MNVAPILPLALATAATPAGVITHATLEPPVDHGPQQVVVQSRSFAPGTESGWHVHPGVEIAVLVSGGLDVMTRGGVRRLQPGDSFVMPRGEPHNGVNPTAADALVVLTLVVDAGAPPRVSVPAP